MQALQGKECEAEVAAEVDQRLSEVGLHCQALRLAKEQYHMEAAGKHMGQRGKRVQEGVLSTPLRYRATFMLRVLLLTETLTQSGLLRTLLCLAVRVAVP